MGLLKVEIRWTVSLMRKSAFITEEQLQSNITESQNDAYLLVYERALNSLPLVTFYRAL